MPKYMAPAKNPLMQKVGVQGLAMGHIQRYGSIWSTESPFKHWSHSHGVKHRPSYTPENDLFTGHVEHFARLIDSWEAAMRVAERFPHPITIVCQPSLSASLSTSLYTPSPVAIKTSVPGGFPRSLSC